MVMRPRILVVFLFLMLSVILFAHGTEESSRSAWEVLGIPDPVNILYIATAVSALGIIAALLVKDGAASGFQKKVIFAVIAAPVAIATLYLAGTTVYLNIVSETGGPVHWHADYQIWRCGEEIDLRDPEGLENRVGAPNIHEHGDNRMHIEGVLLKNEDARLANFFELIGGRLTDEYLRIPANEGEVEMQSGDPCNGNEAELQVFVYRITNAQPSQRTDFEYEQIKVEHFDDYVLAPYSNVPPGDCIIIELDREKERTDKICETYRVAIENGDMGEAGW